MTIRAFTVQNENTGRWELIIDNNVFRKGASEILLLNNIENYRNFNDLGIDKIFLSNGTEFLLGEGIGEERKIQQKTIDQKIEFEVNKRYEFMEKIIKMISSKKIESAIITGNAGLGKTYTVMNTVKSIGLEENVDFEIVKGYSTPKGLYRTMFENKEKIIIFDDCDSILRDPTARNLLKAALDSYDRRIITWNSEASTDDLPKTFEFTGHIIFISNMTLTKFDQALISRSMVIDLSMTDDDVIARMKHVLPNVLPMMDISKKEMALDFIETHVKYIKDLNFRVLIKTCKVVDSFSDEDWKDLALYTISNG